MKLKKSLVFLFIFLLVLNISLNSVKAEVPTQNVPLVGDINPDTGLPSTFEKYQDAADNLSDKETRVQYLKQEWTNIFAKNKLIAPILYYTDSFFSMLNPIWLVIFQITFSWSWQFILSLTMWILITVIFYSTVKTFDYANGLINLIIALCLSSIIGISGGIKQGVTIVAAPLNNLWIVIISIVIAIILVMLYSRIMNQLGKNLKEKAKVERAEIREAKESTHEKIIDTKLKGEGL